MTTDPRPGRRALATLTLVWTLAVGGSGAWGLAAAAVALPWQSLIAAFLAAGLVASSLALSADAVGSDRVDLCRAGRAGALTGLLVLVAVGIASTAGAAGVIGFGLLLASRPGLPTRLRESLDRWRAARRERHGGPTADDEQRRTTTWAGDRDDAWERTLPGSLATEPAPPPLPLPPPQDDAGLDTEPDWSPTLTVPEHLSDLDLCLAWEGSSRALRRCATPAEQLEVVRLRQACLDELERRRPEAVRAWVLEGTDPDSSPARYLTG
ncbi:MAG: hypothetical protein ACLGH4_03190 [Actinomycetes bacterium]